MKPSILLLLMLLSCRRNANEEAVRLSACPSFGCAGGNICLKPANVCVKPCDSHNDCPGGMLCRGYFKDVFNFTGKGQQFCKWADADEGMACESFQTACKRGLACVDGVCRKKCESDKECGETQRCAMEVLPTDSFSPNAAYSVCARASLELNAACTGGAEPYCKKGLVCVDNVCKIRCRFDTECPTPLRCRQNGYFGWRGKLRMIAGEDPDFMYCR